MLQAYASPMELYIMKRNYQRCASFKQINVKTKSIKGAHGEETHTSVTDSHLLPEAEKQCGGKGHKTKAIAVTSI